MRKLGGVLLFFSLLWFLGLTAQAQVAVPSLVPTGVRIGDPAIDIPQASFVTANPATIQWGAPSKWGFGRLDSERTRTLPAGTNTPVNFSGLVVGFRKVEKDFSFAAQLLDLADDTNAVRDADWDVLNGAVAFQSGDNIAFGVGTDRVGNTSQGGSQEFNSINLGMSIEVKAKIFIGFAIGTEDITSSFNGADDRSVQKIGVGYRTGGAINTHLEAYIVEKDEADNFGAEFTDVSSQVLVAEFNLSNVLVAASYTQTARERLELDSTTLAFDLGWAPKNGISLMVHGEQTTTTDSTPGNEEEFDISSTVISLAFQF